MGEQLKNLKCIKQRIISGFFRTINNEFHGFRCYLFSVSIIKRSIKNEQNKEKLTPDLLFYLNP